MNPRMTEAQAQALSWALRRLRTIEENSKRALAEGKLVAQAKENIKHIEELAKLSVHREIMPCK